MICFKRFNLLWTLLLALTVSDALADSQIISEWAKKLEPLNINSSETYLAAMQMDYSKSVLDEIRKEIIENSLTGNQAQEPMPQTSVHPAQPLLPIQLKAFHLVTQLLWEKLNVELYSKKANCSQITRILQLLKEVKQMSGEARLIESDGNISVLELLFTIQESHPISCLIELNEEMSILRDFATNIANDSLQIHLMDDHTKLTTEDVVSYPEVYAYNGKPITKEEFKMITTYYYYDSSWAKGTTHSSIGGAYLGEKFWSKARAISVRENLNVKLSLLEEIFSSISISTQLNQNERSCKKSKLHRFEFNPFTEVYYSKINPNEIRVDLSKEHFIFSWILPKLHRLNSVKEIVKQYSKRQPK